jgi:GNAT superfamily N-acetyltransferase
VIGLGIGEAATSEYVAAIVAFYRSHGRDRFRIELAPGAGPAGLPSWLEASGLQLAADTTTKLVRQTGDVGPPHTDVKVRELDAVHRDAVGELNALAWGAPTDEHSIKWFGATVGAAGFHHYGVFENSRLISTGALVADGPIGWVGFAATHPRHRGQGLRQQINQVRLAEARRLGCRLVHVEIDGQYSSSAKLPFARLYDRCFYASVPEGGSPSPAGPDREGAS